MESKQLADYSPLFLPKSIAVFCNSSSSYDRGALEIDSLLSFGFKGRIYPVSSQEPHIRGLRAYTSLESVPDRVDLVVLAMENNRLGKTIQECTRKGVAGIVATAGSTCPDGNEAKDTGRKEILESLSNTHTRLLGPMSSGIYSPAAGITTLLGRGLSPKSGSTGVFAEQGLEIADICHAAMGRGIRFSQAVDLGRGWDVDAVEMLRYFVADRQTRIIGGYIREMSDCSSLSTVLQQGYRRKPIVMFHPVSPRSRELPMKVTPADFFRSAGALYTSSFRDFVDLLMVLNCFESFRGTHAGLITEQTWYRREGEQAALDHGFSIPVPNHETTAKIAEMMPLGGGYSHPVESSPGSMTIEWVFQLLDLLSQQPAIDFIVIRLPIRTIRFQRKVAQNKEAGDLTALNFATALVKKAKQIRQQAAKQLIVVLPEASTGVDPKREIEDRLAVGKQCCANSIPCFGSVRQAFSILRQIRSYSRSTTISAALPRK